MISFTSMISSQWITREYKKEKISKGSSRVHATAFRELESCQSIYTGFHCVPKKKDQSEFEVSGLELSVRQVLLEI